MQCSLVLVALSGILATCTAAVIPRLVSDQSFIITNFFASGAPHSIYTRWSFNVTDGFTYAYCTTAVSVQPEISYVPTTCCQGPYNCDWQFSFNRAANKTGYALNVTNISPPTSHGDRHVAIKYFPQSDVVDVNGTTPTGGYQYLQAPSNFSVTYTSKLYDEV